MHELGLGKRIRNAWWMRRAGYTLGEVVRHYRAARAQERESADEVRRIQWERLRALVEWSYAQVPYYRDLMDGCGLPPSRIRSADDFARLPLLTKSIIQEEGSRLLARDSGPRPLLQGSSSGSTGQPTRVAISPEAKAAEVANSWSFHAWAGWKPGDRTLRLWGTLAPETRRKRLYRLMGRMCTGEMTRNVHRMDGPAMDEIARDIERYRPRLVIGYTNALHALALHLLAHGRERRGPSGIITLAETLFPHQRHDIEAAFGCRVFNRYASQEVGPLAAECEEGRMHLNASDIHFEFLGPAGPVAAGEPGSVVVTNLHNRAMPLLRYELGDVAVPGGDAACPCGRALPLIADLKGRLSDLIVTPEGRYIFADDIAEIFYPLSEIRQFQVVQESTGELTVRIVVPGDLDPLLADHVRAALRKAVGPDMSVTLERVGDIPRLASGKHRICISRLASFGAAAPTPS